MTINTSELSLSIAPTLNVKMSFRSSSRNDNLSVINPYTSSYTVLSGCGTTVWLVHSLFHFVSWTQCHRGLASHHHYFPISFQYLSISVRHTFRKKLIHRSRMYQLQYSNSTVLLPYPSVRSTIRRRWRSLRDPSSWSVAAGSSHRSCPTVIFAITVIHNLSIHSFSLA